MPQESTNTAKQNRILAALTPNDYARLQDDLELVSLKLGQVLYESGDNLAHVYFPASCIVSLVFTTRKGASAELAITGNDGLVGIPLVLGGDTTTHRAVIQSAGTAYRLKIEVMRWELDQGGELQHLALRYTQALMTQMAQSVVCNRHHSVDQQLCRWLLLSLDRLSDNKLDMTQELIGNMLGVRREAVTEAAGKLQAAGLIHYSRGHITVENRHGLEARACECYSVVKAEYDRLFKLPPNVRPKGRARPNPETLRKRAEARLLQNTPEMARTNWDNAQLVHELQVHQIELEMHNEELRHAYDEADALIERYADIYDFAPVGYFTLDRQGVIVDMNLAGSILLGIKGSQKGRHRFASRIAPQYLAGFETFFVEVFAARDKASGEFVLSANGHRPEATIKIEAVASENSDECRMVVMDISAARKAEQALKEREQYLRAVIDNFPFMVWMKDAEGRFLAANSSLSAYLGLASPEAMIGKTDFDVVSQSQAERYQAEDRFVLEAGKGHTLEETVLVANEERQFEIYKSPVKLTGQPIGTVGFARDVTESRQLEAEQRRLASIDPVTELATAEHFMMHMEQALGTLNRDDQRAFAILVLELDSFEKITAPFGKLTADAALRMFSAGLREEMRQVDFAGRITPNKFAVLLPEADSTAGESFAERLHLRMASSSIAIGGIPISFTLSIGIATIRAGDADSNLGYRLAERAAENARQSGGSRTVLANQTADSRQQTANRLIR